MPRLRRLQKSLRWTITRKGGSKNYWKHEREKQAWLDPQQVKFPLAPPEIQPIKERDKKRPKNPKPLPEKRKTGTSMKNQKRRKRTKCQK